MLISLCRCNTRCKQGETIMRFNLLTFRIILAVVLVVTILSAPSPFHHIAAGVGIGMFISDVMN